MLGCMATKRLGLRRTRTHVRESQLLRWPSALSYYEGMCLDLEVAEGV